MDEFLSLGPRFPSDFLSRLVRFHAELAEDGWYSCDFYDGYIMVELEFRQVRLMDLDCY